MSKLVLLTAVLAVVLLVAVNAEKKVRQEKRSKELVEVKLKDGVRKQLKLPKYIIKDLREIASDFSKKKLRHKGHKAKLAKDIKKQKHYLRKRMQHLKKLIKKKDQMQLKRHMKELHFLKKKMRKILKYEKRSHKKNRKLKENPRSKKRHQKRLNKKMPQPVKKGN